MTSYSLVACLLLVLVLLAACNPSSPEEAFEDHTHQWAEAVISADAEQLVELGTNDGTMRGFHRVVDATVGRDPRVDVNALQVGAPRDELRAVCVTFSDANGVNELRGGLMFRYEDGQWLAWEFRPGMYGCAA